MWHPKGLFPLALTSLINQPFGSKLFTVFGLNGNLLAKAKTDDSGLDYIWEIEMKR